MDIVQVAPSLKFSIDNILRPPDEHSDYSSLSPGSSLSSSPPTTPVYSSSTLEVQLSSSPRVPTRPQPHARNRPPGGEIRADGGRQSSCAQGTTTVLHTVPTRAPYPFLLQVAALRPATYQSSPTYFGRTPAAATIGPISPISPAISDPRRSRTLPTTFYFVTNGTEAAGRRAHGATSIDHSRSSSTGQTTGREKNPKDASDYQDSRTQPVGRTCSKHASFKKKKRTAFTSTQLQELENMFEKQKYLTKHDRCLLAKALGLTEKHVKTWYQNRRTKWKRDTTTVDWSRQREHAATIMYAQYLNSKSPTTGECNSPEDAQTQNCSLF